MTSTSLKAAESNAHLGRLADEAFERHGDRPTVFFEGVWHQSGELVDRACRIASGLARLGVEPGDRVVVTMPNAPDVTVLYNAIWRAGAVVTPAMFLLSVAEMRHLIADSGARFVVTSAAVLDRVRQAVDGLPEVERVICVESDAAGALPLAELESAAPSPVVPREPEDLAALLYTGGTTGRAKGVMLSHANLAFAGRVAAESERGLDLACELMVLPLSHSFGLIVTLASLLTDVPKKWVMLRRFDAERALGLIQAHRVEQVQVVPSMLQLLLSQPIERFDLSSLRIIGSGGAPLAPETVAELTRRLPSTAVLEGYGLTETSTLLTANPPAAAKTGSVGPPMVGVEVRIVDATERPLQAGAVGEICCRSAAVMRGYWNEPDLTAETLRDGWLHTGDVGYVDQDGYVFVLDRKKDLIIRGGFNIYPRDVEDALLEHPAVQMAAVVGRPDEVYGEEAVAFLTLERGAEVAGAEMVAWARDRIGGHKYPREVRLVDSLPLTDVGKVDRKALRALVG